MQNYVMLDELEENLFYDNQLYENLKSIFFRYLEAAALIWLRSMKKVKVIEGLFIIYIFIFLFRGGGDEGGIPYIQQYIIWQKNKMKVL